MAPYTQAGPSIAIPSVASLTEHERHSKPGKDYDRITDGSIARRKSPELGDYFEDASLVAPFRYLAICLSMDSSEQPFDCRALMRQCGTGRKEPLPERSSARTVIAADPQPARAS